MKKKNRRYLLVCLAIFFFFLSGIPNLPSANAAGASLFLAPASGTFVIGDKFTVTVRVATGGQAVNAAEGVVNFDKNYLEVAGVSKSGSIFSLWTSEPGANQSAGTVSFGGGLPPPGYSGQSGKIISITFKAKAVGTGNVRFSSGAVLANDGKGTNILESLGSANFKVAAKEVAEKEPAAPTKPAAPKTPAVPPVETIKQEDEEYNKPAVSSPTHPDQNAWYRAGDAEFRWEPPPAVTGVSFDLNKELAFEPDSVSEGLLSAKTYPGLDNGIWYFHLRYFDGKKWGTTDHYRVLVDRVRPLPFSIEVRQEEPGNYPKLYFKTIDELSGVSAYEIYVNSLEEKRFNLPEDEAQSKLNVQLSALGYGEHTAMVKVTDRAGNETVETVKFTVPPIDTPVIKNYARELKSSDQFFISGTALENINVNVYIQDEDNRLVTKLAHSDKNGNWFHVHDRGLENGRYIAWVDGENLNGIKSLPSEKVSFLVTPPVFARLGSLVINYFTVIVSLLFMVILIILLILYLAGKIRRKLKKETVEVEEVLHQNMAELRKTVEEEMGRLDNLKRVSEFKAENANMKKLLDDQIEKTEKKILSEIKDVEDILK